MLNIQKYLRNGKSFTDLENEFGIKSTFHDTLPLVIVNYSQIDSPKTHPIVREARGLVLNTQDFSLVSRAFPRFFNWGEVADEIPLFDFTDFIVQTKEDGSLVLIYYFNGQWMANTRGSFAQHIMEHQDFTWETAFCKAMKINSLQDLTPLDKSLTYVCEFCSPYNKVVRRYQNPTMFLLTAYHGKDELHYKRVDEHTHNYFVRPNRYEFNSIEAIQDFLQSQITNDPTYEGVVICDKYGHRWKIKSPTYLGLHRLKGDGDNLFNPKHLLPFVLSGEDAELLTYFEEASEAYEKVKTKVNEAYNGLEDVFNISQGIVNQKDYALTIVGKTSFTSILFTLRKEFGINQTKEQLKKAWRNSADTIIKQLF